MNWTALDWKTLDRLREGFLSGSAAKGPYWKSRDDLAHYDATYAERIGWKWDAVLRELKLRGWAPRVRSVLDWGCGSGIASRRTIAAFGPEAFDELRVWDHSPLAMEFAAEAAGKQFPALRVGSATAGFLGGDEPIGLLVISHVLTELPAAALAGLRKLIARAEAVIWVEPGTHAVARQLQQIREESLATHRVVAPCTHASACGLLAPERERDWCHFFAAPPSEIFADPNWVKFGQRAGIDLRSLPYAFLVLDRSAAPAADGLSHIIGRPEQCKVYASFLNCDATGTAELRVHKRDNPALYKALDRAKGPLVYRWQREGDRVSDGTPLG